MAKEIELKNMDTQKTDPETQGLAAKKGKKEKKPAEAAVPFSQLFRFASRNDWILIGLGTLASIANGAAMPLFSLLFGDVADEFSQPSMDAVVDAAGDLSLKLFLVGVGSFIASYFSFACWMITGERQTIEIRKQYFKSLLIQEIGFFDTINPNELSTKIAGECFDIQGGIGEKVSTFVFSISMFVVGFVIGYIKGWQLALVLTGFLPVISITGALFVYAIQKQTKINTEAYSKAGAISEEVLNAIRTVVSLGGQAKETKRYQHELDGNKRAVVRFVVFAGCAMGGIFMAMFAVYALGFFVGSIFIEEHVTNPVTDADYTGGDVLTVFFSIIMAGFSTSQAAPAMKSFAIAKAAGAKAFQIIDRKSQISIEDPRGKKPTNVVGNISFDNVVFAYPTKPDKLILDGISFKIRMNEKTAFVGESGCGKTTCMQLISRFYDIKGGSLTLDGNEIKDLNLKWFRENLGYVGQEPVLFATSIKENLLMAKENATDDEVWEALRKANADTFVRSLPQKLDTFVGTNGAMLSGGQKQRLAIARAILKNPKILLLDEATSALDRKNEMEIQKTLDEISEGRTTIVIAHRLSTVQNADHILVFDQGKVVEEGRHQELVEKKGRYYALQHLQLQTEEKAALEGDDQSPTMQAQEQEIPHMQSKKKSSKKMSSHHAGESHKSADVELKVDNGKAGAKGKKGKKEDEVFGRLFAYNKKERPILIIGLCVALLNGAIFPCLSILLSNMLEVFAFIAPDFRERADILSIMFLVLAVLSFICNAVQLSLMSVVGENLSRKVRIEVFEKYLKMPMGWFDLPENSPGALAAKLAKDASLVNTLTSSVLGIFTQALSSFITGMVIAFVASWQLTLVSLALSPLMIMAGKMQAKFNQGFSADTDGPYQESVAFVAEAVNNMRTVASFGREDKLLENYSKKLQTPLKGAVKRGNLSGLAFGLSQFCNFGIYACVFYVGAIFMREIGLGFQEMLQSIFGIMFAAFGTGNAFQFAPDLGAAKNAAISVFKILDEKPAIDIDDPSQNVRTPIQGNIEFRNVSFKYPSREKQIFKGLSFKISATKKVAFVGPSGCGKSTILALLQRFYDVDEGEILIDGVNIKKYDLKHLRHTYGVVSQEPVLFNGTIEYNIKYSKENATDAEMREIARQANALGFIEKNEFESTAHNNDPNANQGTGFQRKVGPKGSQLSGGQKQRVAIARAILKGPTVLILDEATSALDAQNEKSVQESLDQIMQGKTSLIVAHRISTIKDSDEILVFNDGEIVERGNYQQLTQLQGMFYKLERGMEIAPK